MRAAACTVGLVAGCSAFSLFAPTRAAGAARGSSSAFRMMAGGGDGTLDGWGGSADGGTFFSSWDGRDEEGVSAAGTFPPGEDLIEDELRQLFNVGDEDDDDTSGFGGNDADEVKLMFKLRKELGEKDFARIFKTPRITGEMPGRMTY